jgi:hypothetical protein
MNAGNFHFKLTWSSLWHLLRGATRFSLAQGIAVLRIVLLLDVSKWQGTINFVTMVLAGAMGVIIKCGQGAAQDLRFEENWRKAKLAGMPRGSYWFYDSRVDPKQQAANWWNWIKTDPGELIHFADYEEAYGGTWSGWRSFKIFLEEFMRLSGLPPWKIGIYTGYYYWIANSPIMSADLNWFSQFPLWLAWYTDDPTQVLIPKPWTSLLLWQFGTPVEGEKYGAESLEIDENWFTGDEQTYRNYFKLDGETGGGMKIIKGIAIGNVTRRKSPQGEAFTPARYLVVGDKIEASTNQYQWLKLSKINDVPVMDEEWVSAGSQKQYIAWDWVTVPDDPAPDPETPPAKKIVKGILHFEDGSAQELFPQ